jgi:hypothetical protein
MTDPTDQTALPLPPVEPAMPMAPHLAKIILTGEHFAFVNKRRDVIALHRQAMACISGRDVNFADRVRAIDDARDALLHDLDERQQYESRFRSTPAVRK